MSFSFRRLFNILRVQTCLYSNLQNLNKLVEKAYDITKIRNVGVIAHIDAGKTTTTERMLYYSGYSPSPGNIDEGTTVTDFMEQERERGISITSAVVSFPWKDHSINLIDTPGHIDFTSEVECSLRVLDGALLILDASAGVEAQTLSVWKQALKYRIPQVAFINKMDKKRADFKTSILSIKNKLAIKPLVLQRPLYTDTKDESSFVGVVNLVSMEMYTWGEDRGGYGRDYKVVKVCESGHSSLMEECMKERRELLEDLANLDATIGEQFLQDSDLSCLSEMEVWQGVSRVTQSCRGLPVLCGSSLRNKGVQPLMDSIIACLPDPLHHDLLLLKPTLQQQNTELQHSDVQLQQSGVQLQQSDVQLQQPLVTSQQRLNNTQQQHSHNTHQQQSHNTQQQLMQQATIAFAFKTMHTRNKQPISFLRLHSGIIHKSDLDLYNYSSNAKEKVVKLLQINADEYDELSVVKPGMIFAVTGLKHTKSGDILTSFDPTKTEPSSSSTTTNRSATTRTTLDISDICLMTIPDPVYFCSIEPPTLASQKILDEALLCLCREDPSLKVRVDAMTGQTVLGGMGQLHLEVIQDRILKEYKIDADLGPLQIAYQESMREERRVSIQVDKTISGTKNSVYIVATFFPVSDHSPDTQKDPRHNPRIVDSSLFLRPALKVNLVLSGGKIHKANFSVKADVESEFYKSGLKPSLLKPIQHGLSSGFSHGPLLGYPIGRVHMELNDLQTTAKTSMPFLSSCVSKLVMRAVDKQNASLMQPIMNVEVITTSDLVGIVLSDLSIRGSHIIDVQRSSGDATVAVVARTPLAHLADFSSTLRTKTSGLASFNMSLSSYETVPEKALEELLK